MSNEDFKDMTAVQTIKPKQLLQIILAMLDANQPLMIWGPPGLGKSEIAILAAMLTSRSYHDVRPALWEKTDLLGIPYVDPQGLMRYAFPGTLPHTDSTEGHIINLEELPNANKDMQASMYQMVKDRMCGEYRMPEGARIIACGNRLKDRGGTHRMLAPLGSRFIHVELEPDIEDWMDWAFDNDIDPDVIFYLRFHSESLNDFDPAREENTFPCPRTWANLSRTKPNIEKLEDPILERAAYAGAVGNTAGNAFYAFLQMKPDLPNPTTVLLNPESAKVPENASAKVAIASSLYRKANEFNMDAVCHYATRLGNEVGAFLVSQTLRAHPECENTAGYARWSALQH